jgi:hypothetical protein
VTHSANALEENTINVNIIAAIRTTLSSYKLFSISDLDSASYTHLSDPRRHLRAQLFSDLIKRWQGAADPSLYGVYGDMIEALLPVVIICAVSLLGTAVWLLAAGAYPRKTRIRS